MRWSIVVAQDRSGVIGRAGQLPWQGDMPADLKHFRDLTIGHVIVMGRKTYQSIGRRLDKRVNIVLSRSTELYAPGCFVVNGLQLDAAADGPEVFAIGGAELYRLLWPWTGRIYMTRVEADFAGDTHFPKLSAADWDLVASEEHLPDDRNKYPYTFQTFERR